MNRLAHTRHGRIWAALLLLTLLLAFALRVYHLDGQSMWSDEGLSLYRIQQPLGRIFQNVITVDGFDTRDTNPPFYFLLLHGWATLTGETIFALRYGGVLLALLAVPLMYQIGQASGGRWAGLTAAFLLAISPFHVWQTQDLRNYGLLITLNLLAFYALWRWGQGGQRPWHWLLVWLGATLLATYTHYFGFFMLAYGLAGLVYLSLVRWGGNLRFLWRSRWVWGGAAVALLLLIPAVFIGLERFRAGQQVDFYYIPLPDVLHHALSAFAIGLSRTLVHPWAQIAPSLALVLVGVWGASRRTAPTAVLLVGYLLLPLGLLQFLSLFNPLYNGTRHLLIGLPPFLLLAALGLAGPLPRWIRPATAVFAVIAVALQLNHLHTQFTSPQFIRDDVRGAAEYLNQHARPDDIIILHDTLIGFTFDYYYEGAAPWRAIPLYPNLDPAQATAELQTAGATATSRIWFLTEPTPRTGFPRTALVEWAQAHWPLVFAQQFPAMWLPVRLEAYLPNPVVTAVPPTATAVDEHFGNTLTFHAQEFPTTIHAGQTAWWTTYWSTTAALTPPYTLSLRIQDETGHVWFQNDGTLSPAFAPDQWPNAALVRFDQPLAVPASLPAGDYAIVVRLLDAQNQSLPNATGLIDIPLGQVTVRGSSAASQPDLSTLPPLTGQAQDMGPLTLLGVQPPQGELRPGHLLSLPLFWQADRAPTADYQVRLQMLNAAGQTLAENISPISRASYPTSQWPAGAVVQGVATLAIPTTAATDAVHLQVTLLDMAGTPVGQPVPLDTPLAITPWPLLAELPPVPIPHTADFGTPPLIHLHGYDLPQTAHAGEGLALTLFWQSLADITGNYVVFVHLTDADGNVVAQADGVPLNGVRLTVSWRTAEFLVDGRQLYLPADLPAGDYDLWVGFFDPETGIRLPTSGAGADPANGRVRFGSLTLLP